MNILESQQQILSFCMIPRTSSEIATMLGLKRNSIYPMLNNLVLSKELKKTGNKKRQSDIFTNTKVIHQVVQQKQLHDNFHAHNPFGL